MSPEVAVELERECSTCGCYGCGLCRRFPTFVSRDPEDYCWEHRFKAPPSDILETDLDLLHVKERTRSVYRHARLKTVDDLVVLGPQGVRNRFGNMDKDAIRDLRAALSRLGVDW